MPSVLFINRVYPPGNGATGELLAELAEALAQRGWTVTVIAGRPAGVTARRETRNGVRLEWVGGLPFTRRSHWRRALSYLSLYPALLWRAWRVPRADAVVLLTDPPLVLALGPLIRLGRRSRMVHWAQDLYPEVAECLGVLRPGGLLARGLRGLSTWAMRRCARVIVVGECMRQRIVGRGIDPQRITVIPNWVNHAQVRPVPREGNAFRKGHRLEEGAFVVMYSGNVGLAHTFDAVLDAAARLRVSAPHIVFLLVGDGPRLEWVRSQVTGRGLGNVRILPPVTRARLAESLSAGDVHLVTMRDDLCGLVVPSKLYGVMAAGRPAIFIGPPASEAAHFIQRHRAGSAIANGTGEQLARCLETWAADSVELAAAGARAAQSVAATGPEAAALAFENVLA